MRVSQTPPPHSDPLVQVASLSDLFFNYDHTHRVAFDQIENEGHQADPEAYYAARRVELLKDEGAG